MNLLIIEDDEKVAAIFAEVFGAEGHAITVRTTGEDGLRYLAATRPDAILLDLKLPNMSGIDVLRDIRSRDTDMPVIVITGHASPEEFAEITRLGITDFIEKPLILKQLTGALGRIPRS
jgi:DNA-binding response OmpR family regulator